MLPRCAHGLLWQSPTTSGSFTCGAQLFFQFLEDPTATPLDSCVDQIQPVDFTGDPGYSQYLLGTDDMWENGVTPPRPPGAPAVVPVEPPDLQRVRRELRRRLRGLTLR